MEEQSYTRLTQRLKALKAANTTLDILDVIDDYPIYCILLRKQARASKNIMLSAGIHGDEPAGPEAVLCFLEQDNTDLLQRFNFVILPCVNPYGYVHNRRENKDGIDLNRSFEKGNIATINAVKKAIRDRFFDLSIDFHEDWEAKGFYLYEGQRDERWIGQKITENVKKFMPIDGDAGESDLPIVEGVFKVDPVWGQQGLASYLLDSHSNHVMICETPSSFPIEKRVIAHLTALDVALNSFEFASNE